MNRITAAAVALLCLAMASRAGVVLGADETEGTKPRTLSEEETDRLLARVEKELGGIRVLKAHFTQEQHLSMFKSPVTMHGVFLFRSPNSVRFEILDPFQSILVVQKKTVEKYEYFRERWQRLAVGDRDAVLTVMGQIASWTQGKIRDQDGPYGVSARNEGHPVIVLTPHSPSLREYIGTIELNLSSDPLRLMSIKVSEPGGDFTLIRFTSEERNGVLPAHAFDASAPMGAQDN